MSVNVSDTLIVDPGGSVELMCNVTDALNSTEITWSSSGLTGPPLDNITSRFDSNSSLLVSSVLISNVSYADGGMYTCTVSNSGPIRSTSTLVIITPTINSSDLISSIRDESSVLLCNIQSSPMSEVRWVMYDFDGGMQDLMENSGSGSGSGLMTFNNVRLEFEPVMFEDAGMYQCVVRFEGFAEDVKSQNVTLSGTFRFV